MDIQIILDQYFCASYVLDYVNESNRGMTVWLTYTESDSNFVFHIGNLECKEMELLSQLGTGMLKSVEIHNCWRGCLVFITIPANIHTRKQKKNHSNGEIRSPMNFIRKTMRIPIQPSNLWRWMWNDDSTWRFQHRGAFFLDTSISASLTIPVNRQH